MTTAENASDPTGLIIDYPRVKTVGATGNRYASIAHCLVRNGHGLDLTDTAMPHERLAHLIHPAFRVGAVSLAVLAVTGVVTLFFAGAGQLPGPWVTTARIAAVLGIAGFLYSAAVLTSPTILLRPFVQRWETQNIAWWERNRTLIRDVFDMGGSRRREVTDIVLDLNRITRSLDELSPEPAASEAVAAAIRDAVDTIWAYIDAADVPDNQPLEEVAYRAVAAQASVAASLARRYARA